MGTIDERWMNLQVAYDLRRAEQASGVKIKSEITPRERKAYEE
jgi:plasmid maintenance system antidote protein VapI